MSRPTPILLYLTILASQPLLGQRPVTVPDMIGMTVVGDDQDEGAESYLGTLHLTHWSIEGDRLAVRIGRGDLARNATVWSVLLFERRAIESGRAHPDTVLTLVSYTNRPAIQRLRWLPGGRTLVLLAEGVHGSRDTLPQVYAFDVRTRKLVALTHLTSLISSYDVSSDGSRLLVNAAPPVDSVAAARRRDTGDVVSPAVALWQAVSGAWDTSPYGDESEMVAIALAQHRATRVHLPAIGAHCHRSELSPSGRYAIAECTVDSAPPMWTAYANEPPGAVGVFTDMLIDCETGQMTPLIDAPGSLLSPVGRAFDPSWSPDESVIVVTNSRLPLAGVDSAERRVRTTLIATVAVDVATGQYTVLARRDSLKVIRWDKATGAVVLGSARPNDTTQVAFARRGRTWAPVSVPPAPTPASGCTQGAGRPDVYLEEDLNTPPRIVAKVGSARERVVLLDPNPAFARLAFGHEEVFKWRTEDGEWQGGLYYPVGYERGRRYPLVIQTHDFPPNRFRIDGAYTTGTAAQALAGKGIMVLQFAREPRYDLWSRPEEGPYEVRGLTQAIDALDSLGLIDRTRIGLVGFSRTCYHVKYLLTHADSTRYPIAAAAVSDGVDLGYLQYVGGFGALQTWYESMNGGSPFRAESLERWRVSAPGFNLERVHTPMRMEAITRTSLIGEWEWYAGLKRLGTPVELMYYPDGVHVLVKPRERLASQGGNLDWFRFWLTGEQDPDPAKAAQYSRWRRLRAAQQAPEADHRTAQKAAP